MPYISMAISLALIARLTVFVRPRSGSEFTNIDSLATIQIGLIALSCILLILFSRHKEIWRGLAGTSGMMLVTYYVVSALSAAWSPLPQYSLFRAIEYLSQMLLAFIMILYCSDFAEAERRALFVAMVASLFGAGMIVKFHGFTLNWNQWHTNHYTTSAAIIFCYCFGELMGRPQERKQWLWPYGCASLGLVLLGTSIASFFAVGVGSMTAVVLSKRGRSLLLPLLIAVGATSGLVMSEGDAPTSRPWTEVGQQLKILSPQDSAQPVVTFNGRIMLWTIYAQEIGNRPILGHGFAVSSRLANIYTSNAHNGLLAALLGTGAVGLFIIGWSAYRFTCEIESCRQEDTPGAIGCAAALSAAFVNNMSISIIGENWRAPSLVCILFLGLHLFFVLRPKIVSSARQRPSVASLNTPMPRSPRIYHPAGPRPIMLRRRARFWRARSR